MSTRTTAAAILTAASLTLAACTASSDTTANKPQRTATPTADQGAAEKVAGIPPKPTGAKRQQLLDALAKVAPDVVTYEDKAIDAARNQCAAINGGGERLDYFASQRFTYKDVTTSEAQGAKINKALQGGGFCKV